MIKTIQGLLATGSPVEIRESDLVKEGKLVGEEMGHVWYQQIQYLLASSPVWPLCQICCAH